MFLMPGSRAKPRPRVRQPTIQVFTSGSGTYLPSSNLVAFISVRAIGGGGGGQGGTSTLPARKAAFRLPVR